MKKKLENTSLTRFTRRKAYKKLTEIKDNYLIALREPIHKSKWPQQEEKLRDLFQEILIWEKVALYFGEPEITDEIMDLQDVDRIKITGWRFRIEEIKSQK